MYFDFHYAMRICGPLNLLKKKKNKGKRNVVMNKEYILYYGSSLLI